MKINRTELYHECMKTKKGFEFWPEWIEKAVTRIIINDQYNKSKKKRAQVVKKLTHRKSTSIQMHEPMKVTDNYFN